MVHESSEANGTNPIGAQDRTSRRNFIGGSSAAIVALMLAETRREDLGKIAKAHCGPSAADPGPENVLLRDDNPNTFMPPATDHGEVQTFWASFSNAHGRIQDGGWSRQVTVEDFPISKDIAGVNMRLRASKTRT